MSSARKALATVALVAGAGLLAAAPAEAATGQLTVSDSTTGQYKTYIDPPAGCHRPGVFDTVVNQTGASVIVFIDENCRVGGQEIRPGTGAVTVGGRLSVLVP